MFWIACKAKSAIALGSRVFCAMRKDHDTQTPDNKGSGHLHVKFTFIILFGCLLQIYAKGLSQTVTLSENKASLESVFKKIKKQTGYGFVYTNYVLQKANPVTVHISNASIDETMELCLKDQPLTYSITNKMISISEKKPSVSAPPKAMELATTITAPPIAIAGKVVDESGAAVQGASVVVKGTTIGVSTNEVGEFKVNVPDNKAILVISSVSFETLEVPVGNQTVLRIPLRKSLEKIEEVVVVGYGTQRKVSVTGGVDVVKTQALQGRPNVNVTQALQGTAPSLIVQQKSFEPGQAANINIRGVGTLGNNDPLVVIDGIIGGDLNLLNPNDIESISILKDAGTAAIYGSRSANGVILVTTKKGSKSDKGTVTYNGIVSGIHPHIWPKAVPGYENMILKNEAIINANTGQVPTYTPAEIQAQKDRGDYEWFLDEILKDAIQQNHNLSISGGRDKSTYMISAGYMDQQSNFVGPKKGLRRYNFRMNLSNEVGKLKFTTILAYTHTDINDHSYNTGTLIVDAERTPKYYQQKDSLGRYLTNDVLTEFNPLGILEKGGYRQYDNDNIFGSINADLEIFKGLHLKGIFGANLTMNHQYYKTDYVPFYPKGQYGNIAGSSTGDANDKNLYTNPQLLLEYGKSFGQHRITAMAGVTNESYTGKSNKVGYKYASPDLGLQIDTTKASLDMNALATTPQTTTENSLNSFIGRLTYSFADKYFAEFNFREDGSSKFAKDHRWGFFPSISGAWRLGMEDFYAASDIKNYINDVKIRASYGSLGNQNVSNYQWQTTYFTFANAYGFNNNVVTGAGFNTANPDLRWEVAQTFNIGADLTFFKGKLTGSFDYFHKLTKDILMRPPLPGTFGGGQVDFNVASVKNRGWEVSLNYNTSGRIFRHSLNFNIGDTRNEIVKMADGKPQITGLEELQVINAEGLPIASYVGYKRDGYFQNLNDIKNKAKFSGLDVVPGDISYKDKNGDGVIDDQDRYILGNPFPRYTFGFNYTLGWKGFDLGIFIQGVGKRDFAIRGELVEPFHVNYSYVMFEHQLDYWRPDNINAKYPRLAVGGSASNTNNYRKGSDLYIFDGAYARLKNVQLGYTLPSNVARKIGMQKCRAYLTGQNLLTVTKNSFIDPESTEFDNKLYAGNGANSGRVYPTSVYYGFGLDLIF
ncbi:TonB-dependent receptor [Chitinophagaceae bacterium 26-R-25]|nr:TonB-dependent receptor [Chitinophagaceae bacterium 26-R-25]